MSARTFFNDYEARYCASDAGERVCVCDFGSATGKRVLVTYVATPSLLPRLSVKLVEWNAARWKSRSVKVRCCALCSRVALRQRGEESTRRVRPRGFVACTEGIVLRREQSRRVSEILENVEKNVTLWVPFVASLIEKISRFYFLENLLDSKYIYIYICLGGGIKIGTFNFE